MKKFFILIFLSTYLFSCALCNLYSPKALVDINITSDTTYIKNITFTFFFNDEFTKETIRMYDDNRNKQIDKFELENVKKDLFQYFKDTRYFTDVKYYNKNEDENDIFKIQNLENKNIELVDNKISLSYTINPNFEINTKNILFVSIKDDSNYFSFMIKKIFADDKKYIFDDNINNNFVYIDIKDKANNIEKIQKDTKQDIEEIKQNSIYDTLSLYLKTIHTNIKDNLESIKDTNSITSYIWLIAFSFLYGVLHALGPGHGKSLVSSYFLSQKRDYTKAISVSFMIGVVHTFSAFLLTLVVYYVLNTFLSKYFTNIEYFALKISAVIIIAIALYLLYKKLKPKPKIKTFKISTTNNFVLEQNNKIHTSSCSCLACNNDSTDYWLVLSAGIVPCAGTVTIFIFTMSMGIYFVGFLSAIFMSLGMSLIIFLSASISILIKKRIENKTSKVTKFLEYGSLLFVLSLGIMLLVF